MGEEILCFNWEGTMAEDCGYSEVYVQRECTKLG